MLISGVPLQDVLASAARRVHGLQNIFAPSERIALLRTALADAAEDLAQPRPDRPLDAAQVGRRVLQIYRYALNLTATGPLHARDGLEEVTNTLADALVDLDLLVAILSTSPSRGDLS